ncbi:MAG: PilN domain-containing protein, partial [Gammaproteobacteria bacterium]
ELVDSLPEGVYLKEIVQKGKNFTIKGVAQSNARVSNYMRNVEKSDWLKSPTLDVIETSTEDGRRIANFTLRFQQSSPQPPSGDEEEDA